MRIRYSREAIANLLEIDAFISRDDPQAAEAWVRKLRARFRRAAATPLAGRVVPELGRADVREVFVRSYRLVYQVKKREIMLLTVFEGRRRLRKHRLLR